MAKGTVLSRFTPLRESGGKRLQSEPGTSGRRLYRNVTIIKAGLGNQRDRNYYPASVLEANINRFDGLRAYADHQDSLSEEVQPERTVRDMVGVYTHPRFVREGKHGGRVVANLHLMRSAKWLSDTIDDLIDLGQADKIGLSINGRGKTVEKQVTPGELGLEEAADPINVNWVEDFILLRSADVVTEAGAGGGFHQLLESARESSAQETAMKTLNEQQKTALKAAVDAGDVEKLNALMQECGCMEAPAAPAKGKKAAPTKEVEPADTDAEDVDEDADEAEEQNALEAEAAAIVDEAEDVDEAEEAEDDGDACEEADADEVDEADGDEDEPVREAGPYKGNGVKGGAGTFGVKGGGGKGRHGGTIKGPKMGGGRFTKNASSQKGQKGQRYAEADADGALYRKIEKLTEENARLSAQLRVRTTTDRARKLIQESAIPRKLQPDVLRLCVGKSEDEMRRTIRYHERLVEAAVAELDSPVEGAGSTRFRESYHGGGAADDIAAVLDEIGLPTRDDK